MASIRDFNKLFADSKHLQQINQMNERIRQITQTPPAIQRIIDTENKWSAVLQRNHEIANMGLNPQLQDSMMAWHSKIDFSGIEDSIRRVSGIYDNINISSMTNALQTFAKTASAISSQVDWSAIYDSVNIVANALSQNRINVVDTFQPAFTQFLEWQSKNEQAILGINRVASMMSDGLISSLDGMARVIGGVNDGIVHPVNQIDWGNLHFDIEENSLVYGDEIYSIDDLNQDIASLDNEADTLTIKERFERIKAKYWVFFAIISLLWFLPEAVDKVVWYAENIPPIIEKLYDDEVAATQNAISYVYVIKETAILRELPNAKSNAKQNLVYDTPLRVISVVPRWIEVEYIADSDDAIRGWISKVSVKYDGTELNK